MKILHSIIFLSIIILTVFPLSSYGQDINPGKWELDGKSVQQEIKSKDLETLGKLPGEKRRQILNEMGSRTFSFFEDGTFRADWIFRGQKQQMEGKWHTEDGRLSIDSGSGVKTYKIAVSNEKKLVLIPDVQGGFFQKLVFIKPE